MDSITLGLTIGGIIVGALASYFVSLHFFQKSIKKKTLIPFVQFASKLFSELDPELKDNLKVSYKDLEIENITQAQFVVANSGDIPIRDIIEPLKLILPKENKILGINIIHIEPEGRNITFKTIENDDCNIIEFYVPLLNGSDYFVFKILIQDSLPQVKEIESEDKKQKFEFLITADDLPPKLTIESLPFSYYEEEKNDSYEWAPLLLGIVSLLITTAIFGTILSLKFSTKGLYLLEFNEFFNSKTFSIYNVYILILTIIGILFSVLMIIGFITSISQLTPDEKPKFKVPKNLKNERRFPSFEFFG